MKNIKPGEQNRGTVMEILTVHSGINEKCDDNRRTTHDDDIRGISARGSRSIKAA